MYFAYGTPQRLGASDALWLDLQPSYDSSLFAAISSDTIVLWTAKPRIVVGQYRRGPESLARDGTNVAITWQTTGGAFAILTSKGAVICVGVDLEDSLALSVQLRNGQLASQTDGRGVPSYSMVVRFIIRSPDRPATCVFGGRDAILCFNSNGLITMVSWRGIRNQNVVWMLPEGLTVIKLYRGVVKDSYLALLADGRVAVLVLLPLLESSIVDQSIEPKLPVRLTIISKSEGNISHQSSSAPTMKQTANDVSVSLMSETPTAPSETPEQVPSTTEATVTSPAIAEITTPTIVVNPDDVVTSLAVNRMFQRLAVGTVGGSILVYSLEKPEQPHLLATWCPLDQPHKASIRCLTWTRDGRALAVGSSAKKVSEKSLDWCSKESMTSSHLTVFSVFGTVLMRSAVSPEDIQDNISKPVEGVSITGFTDMFPNGIRGLFWGAAGTDLFVLPYPAPPAKLEELLDSATSTVPHGLLPIHRRFASAYDSPNGNAYIFVIPFIKSALATIHSQSNCGYATLLGNDHFLLDTASVDNQRTIRPDVRRWRQIQITPMYLVDNWPISCVASNAHGSVLAIAGHRGFALYHCITNKWKLFGNMQHERDFRVTGGIGWIGDIVVAAVQDVNTKDYELRFYSRLANLDASLILHTEKLDSECVHLSTTPHGTVLVYTVDNILREMKFTLNTKPAKATVEIWFSTSLATVLNEPWRLLSVSWYPPLESGQDPKQTDDRALLILVGGDLLLYHPKTREPHQKLSSEALFSWIAPSDSKEAPVHALQKSLWVAEGSGVKLWLSHPKSSEQNQSDESSLAYLSLQPLSSGPLRFSTEFSPLGVLIESAVVLGASAHPHAFDMVDQTFVSHRVRMEARLFLHYVLKALLTQKRFSEATQLATLYRDLSYFSHSLEFLLHEAVETDISLQKNSETTLALVLQFVEQFPHHLDVLVQCARKTEVESWPRLFGYTGNPADLFEECLATGRLKTAAQYLIILQNMVPDSVSGKNAIKLLEATMLREDYETAQELLRFLMTIGGCKELFVSSRPRHGSSSSKLGGSSPVLARVTLSVSPVENVYQLPPDSETSMEGSTLSVDTSSNEIYLEVVLARHARRMLQDGRLRSLARFTKMLNLPLAGLMAREKKRAALVDDYYRAFVSLHRQFMWNFPEQSTSSRIGAFDAGLRGSTVIPMFARPSEPDHKANNHQPTAVPIAQPITRTSSSSSSLPSTNLIVTNPLNNNTTQNDTLIDEHLDFHRDQKAVELNELLDAAIRAQCFDWVVLLGMMLGAVQPVADALKPSSFIVEETPISKAPKPSDSSAPTTKPTPPPKIPSPEPANNSSSSSSSSWLGWFFGSTQEKATEVEDHFAVGQEDNSIQSNGDETFPIQKRVAGLSVDSLSSERREAALSETAATSSQVNSWKRRETLLNAMLEKLDSPGYNHFIQVVQRTILETSV